LARADVQARWWWGVAAVVLALLATWGAYVKVTGPDEGGFQLNTTHTPALAELQTALFQSVAAPLRPGHDVRLLDNGAVFDTIVADVRAARSSIHVLMYIWESGVASDRVLQALRERTQAGVTCRILVDAFGSAGFTEQLAPQLEAAGCEVRLFRPLPGGAELARNHRKLVVIDGKVAVTGGFGIRDNWLGGGLKDDEWRDTQVRFAGPAVRDAQQAFAENWQEAGGALLPPAAFPELEGAGPAHAAFVASTGANTVTRAERLMQLLIQFGRQRIWISNAYFVPSVAITRLLERKASEGVDVRVLVAGKQSDSKTSFGAQQLEYGSLTRAGVRIWEYEPSMLHSKAMLVDTELAVVGSINLDPLSLNELEEAALVTRDADVNSQLAQSFLRDCERAREHDRN
jgi:cardiolipin synthase